MKKTILDFRQALFDENLQVYGLRHYQHGLFNAYATNGLDLLYYGGELLEVRVDGRDIEEIFAIPKSPETKELDLANRLTDEALQHILAFIMKGEEYGKTA